MAGREIETNEHIVHGPQASVRGKCLVISPGIEIGLAKRLPIPLRVVRIEAHRAEDQVDTLTRLAEIAQAAPEVREHVGIVRIELDGLPVFRDSEFPLSAIEMAGAQHA